MNTGCKQIVFLEEYAGAEKSETLWKSSRSNRVIVSTKEGKYKGLDTWVKFVMPPFILEASLSKEDQVKFAEESHKPLKVEMHPRKFGNLGW